MNFIYHPAVVDWDEVKNLANAGHSVTITATLPAIGELCRATRENDCPACEADGVHATDGSGPYDCYACGKKATREGDGAVGEIGELNGKVIVLYSQDQIGHLTKGTKLYTHPQDASADAERTREGDSEQRSLNQRAEAWDAVVATCLEADPNALASYGRTGRESIVAFIKSRTLSRVAVQDDTTGINPNETTAALRGMEKAP